MAKNDTAAKAKPSGLDTIKVSRTTSDKLRQDHATHWPDVFLFTIADKALMRGLASMLEEKRKTERLVRKAERLEQAQPKERR